MIDKEQVKQAGFKVIESDRLSTDKKQEKLEKIKALIPGLISDNKLIDVSALEDFIGPENLAASQQGYSLNFAGKGLAKMKADLATQKELKIEQKQSKNYNKTENVIIRGDNLDVLKLLRQNYEGKIKMIYIDPPYNTRSDEFIYTDNFREKESELIEKYALDEDKIKFFENMYGTRTHSGWLYFMYPRLKLARDLLTDDGAIFISIDDSEQANLKIMCDEIFGSGNFVSSIIWHRKDNASYLGKDIVLLKEYILFYKKSSKFHGTIGKKKDPKRHRELINVSNKAQERLLSKDAVVFINADYTGTVKKGKYGEDQFEIEVLKDFDVMKGKPSKDIHMRGRFSWGQNKIDSEIKSGGKIRIATKDSFKPIFLRKIDSNEEENPSLYNPMIDILSKKIDDRMKTTHDANKHLKALFKKAEVFSTAKPHELLMHLVSSITKFSKDSIVLDFFAGTGTTAEAVMRLNKEDLEGGGGGENLS